MGHTLDLELVRTFLTVLETEGFKPAAARLNKTPAAISMQIKRLEAALGKRVLQRSNQGIALTPAGKVLRERGQRLMSLNYELLGDIRDNELKGPLTFGAPADYSPTILKLLIPIFQRDFPGVSPSIVLEPSRVLRPLVQSGTLDMAVVAREPDEGEGHPLWSEEFDWFGSATSRDGTPRVGLLSTNCVLRDRALRNLAAVPGGHSCILEAATVSSLRDAVEAGFCQAFLPVSIATGLDRSSALAKSGSLVLTFALIAGSSFDPQVTQRIARKFKSALEE